jgi:hypothetical protein
VLLANMSLVPSGIDISLNNAYLDEDTFYRWSYRNLGLWNDNSEVANVPIRFRNSIRRKVGCDTRVEAYGLNCGTIYRLA